MMDFNREACPSVFLFAYRSRHHVFPTDDHQSFSRLQSISRLDRDRGALPLLSRAQLRDCLNAGCGDVGVGG